MGEMNLQQILKNSGGGKPSIISTSLKYFLWPAKSERNSLNNPGNNKSGTFTQMYSN